MKPTFLTAASVALALLAAPAGAQNSSAESPAVPAPPPAKAETPPPATAPTTSPPPTTSSNIVETSPPPPVQSAPAPAPAPITISPDAAYPEGFADPADPFANDLALANRNQQSGGFPWGLLGLLGLLGLIPLLRGSGPRTIYVERDQPPRRAVNRDILDR
jgi:hypothetical protein